MRDDGVVHVLEEERGVIEDVERNAVRKFDQIQLTLLRHDVVDVRFEFRVCLEDFGSDAPLHRGLDFGL